MNKKDKNKPVQDHQRKSDDIETAKIKTESVNPPAERAGNYRFYKIKFRPPQGSNKYTTYEFDYDIIKTRDAEDNETKEEYTFHCQDVAVDEFKDTLQALKPYIVDFCELPKEYVSRIEARGVSFDYNGEHKTMGCVITGVMRYKKSNGVLVLNTPHKAEHFYNDAETGDKNLLIPDECGEILYELFNRAKDYIKGEREQVEIEFKKPSKREKKDAEQLELVE